MSEQNSPEETPKPQVSFSQKVNRSDVPASVMRLAEALSLRHGAVRISNEANGLHLYMASPAALLTDGVKELRSCHLAVNASKYLGIGKHEGKGKKGMVALCMKTNTRFTVVELMHMLPLAQRGIPPALIRTGVLESIKSEFLVDDGRGNMIPESPGACRSLLDLPLGHPVNEYILGRGFDPRQLVRMFRASFCDTELEEDRVRKRFYGRMPGGFKNTPQGRLIMFADMLGVQQGWQGRILDREVNDGLGLEYWHPYEQRWVLVQTRETKRNKWMPIPGFASDTRGRSWDPHKYLFPRGEGIRNSLLMGLDAALAWQEKTGCKTAVLAEGPLDAGKIGEPALAMTGKYLSDTQAELLQRHFKKIVFVADSDKAGREAVKRLMERMEGHLPLKIIKLEGLYSNKDVGELSHNEARQLVEKYL